jgi:hypothetical protein
VVELWTLSGCDPPSSSFVARYVDLYICYESHHRKLSVMQTAREKEYADKKGTTVEELVKPLAKSSTIDDCIQRSLPSST